MCRFVREWCCRRAARTGFHVWLCCGAVRCYPHSHAHSDMLHRNRVPPGKTFRLEVSAARRRLRSPVSCPSMPRGKQPRPHRRTSSEGGASWPLSTTTFTTRATPLSSTESYVTYPLSNRMVTLTYAHTSMKALYHARHVVMLSALAPGIA